MQFMNISVLILEFFEKWYANQHIYVAYFSKLIPIVLASHYISSKQQSRNKINSNSIYCIEKKKEMQLRAKS